MLCTQPRPTVDVIIPLYNVELFIAQSLRSALQQTYPVNKVIVVNDGSQDKGPEIVAAIKQADERVVLLHGPNQGLSSARNKGILESDAEYVAFLDSDDIWEKDKIAKQVALMLARPELVFVHCAYSLIDQHGVAIENANSSFFPNVEPTFENIRLGLYPVTGSASAVLAVRQRCIEAGFFDPLFSSRGEDWDMWARLAEYGPLAMVPEQLVRIRIKPFGIQYSIAAAERVNMQVWCRIQLSERWKHDSGFMAQARQLLREEIYTVAGGYQHNPKKLKRLYIELSTSKYLLARTAFSGPLGFVFFLFAKGKNKPQALIVHILYRMKHMASKVIKKLFLNDS